jgi:hypothetical protein
MCLLVQPTALYTTTPLGHRQVPHLPPDFHSQVHQHAPCFTGTLVLVVHLAIPHALGILLYLLHSQARRLHVT